MRVVSCSKCGIAYQLGGDPDEIKHLISTLPENLPCTTPLCEGRMVFHKRVPPWSHVVSIPMSTFYRAAQGFGGARGDPAVFDRAATLLKSKRIVEVHGRSAGHPERAILKTLVLEDGTRLHLDSSNLGACLYYIEEATPTCVEVFENELSAISEQEHSEECLEDREEAGRIDPVTECLKRLEPIDVPSVDSEDGLREPSLSDLPGAGEVPPPSWRK